MVGAMVQHSRHSKNGGLVLSCNHTRCKTALAIPDMHILTYGIFNLSSNNSYQNKGSKIAFPS